MGRYMTTDEAQKQANPMEKWTKKVGQKFFLSRNILSDMRVVTPENSRTIHPEGKHLEKENEEESCQAERDQRKRMQHKININDKTRKLLHNQGHTWK